MKPWMEPIWTEIVSNCRVHMAYSPLGHLRLTFFVSNKRRFHSCLTSQPKGQSSFGHPAGSL